MIGFAKLALSLGLAATYWVPIRRWMGRWGSTPEERARVMPGDALITNPSKFDTQAVNVNAPAQDIWPWLVQMGARRGGLYSYDWLDRLFGFLDRPSATQILPEFQHLEVGDTINWGGEDLTVASVEADRTLVLHDNSHKWMDWVWEFGLYPVDEEHTRLVSRGIERVPNTLAAWLFLRVSEPTAFVMTRKMLLNLRDRAERLHASAGAHVTAAAAS